MQGFRAVLKGRHVMLAGGLVAMSLWGFGASSAPASYEPTIAESLRSVDSRGYYVEFQKTADWDLGDGQRGYSAQVTILNSGNKSLHNWELDEPSIYPCPDMEYSERLDPANTYARSVWSRLSVEDRRDEMAGRLVWSGTSFTPPSPLFRPR